MLYAARWWPLWPDEKGKLQIPALWGTGSITVQIRDENGEWVTHSELRLQTGENRSIQVPIGATARAIPEHPLPEGLR